MKTSGESNHFDVSSLSERAIRRPARGGGFTLIELVTVMVIAAILAAVAVPTLSGQAESRLNLASGELLRDLTYARQYAVATDATMWVSIDPTNESWTVLAEDPDNPGKANATVLVDAATGTEYTQSLNQSSFAGVEITGSNFDAGDDIGFDWLGRPLNAAEDPLAANGTVTLNGTHIITVEAGTGYIRQTSP